MLENNIEQFTIYCTPEQVKKAIDLGAGIEVYNYFDSDDIKESNNFYKDKFIELPDGRLIDRIISEQMIGWLESCNIFPNAIWDDCVYISEVRDINGGFIGGEKYFDKRKDAIIYAIDVALDYLIKNNYVRKT